MLRGMRAPHELILLGYWASETEPQWPDPRGLVDHEWDPDERDAVASYLDAGLIARGYMGFSPCRICGEANGNMEYTDLTYVWPSGLAHYVRVHDVRLPTRFVEHATAIQDAVEMAERDTSWWRGVPS